MAKRYSLVLTGEETALLLFLTRLGLAQLKFDTTQPEAERAEEVRVTMRLVRTTPEAVHESLALKLNGIMEEHMKELES